MIVIAALFLQHGAVVAATGCVSCCSDKCTVYSLSRPVCAALTLATVINNLQILHYVNVDSYRLFTAMSVARVCMWEI